MTPTVTPAPTATPSTDGQVPYNDTVRALTGRIQAENYDRGGPGVAYTDVDPSNNGGEYRDGGVDIERSMDTPGGYSVGWTRPGESLEYTVEAEPGTYDVRFRVATARTDRRVRVSLDGKALGTATVPSTGGWYTWETVELSNVTVDADGRAVLRLEFLDAGLNVNWVEFERTGSLSTPTPTPTSTPSLIAGDGRDGDRRPSDTSRPSPSLTRTPTGAGTPTPALERASSGVEITRQLLPNGTRYVVLVSNPTPGERLDLSFDADDPGRADGVGLRGLAFVPETGEDIRLVLTLTRDPLDGAPVFEPGDNTTGLARLRIEHSISNEDVDDVSVRFAVSNDRLDRASADPDEISLYRQNVSWNELPTTVVGDTVTSYVFSADSPGFSAFAIGAKQSSFVVRQADLLNDSVLVGEVIHVRLRVANTGGADGVYYAALRLNETVVDDRELTIAANGTRQLLFVHPMQRVGSHRVYVNSLLTGTVVVEPGGRAQAGATVSAVGERTVDAVFGPGSATGPAVGLAALLLLLVVVVLALRVGR